MKLQPLLRTLLHLPTKQEIWALLWPEGAVLMAPGYVETTAVTWCKVVRIESTGKVLAGVTMF